MNTRERWFFNQWHRRLERKKVSTPNGRPTYDLLVICLGALTLSNRRLKELKPLNYVHVTNILHIPWVPEVFLACSGNFRCWPEADTSSAVGRSHDKTRQKPETALEKSLAPRVSCILLGLEFCYVLMHNNRKVKVNIKPVEYMTKMPFSGQ